ncbi:hypothetical protein UJ15_004683 [Salmonella enterica subsp. enterica]|nr:hypothetical protein [Salmonella enterica]EDQ3692325.1 hypothetical protein [Salmonella enterica subsp. enterica serovar Bonariensis]
MNNPLETVTQAVNSLLTALKLPDESAKANQILTGLAVWLVSLTATSLPRFWPADFFPVFYTCHLAALGVLIL